MNLIQPRTKAVRDENRDLLADAYSNWKIGELLLSALECTWH